MQYGNDIYRTKEMILLRRLLAAVLLLAVFPLVACRPVAQPPRPEAETVLASMLVSHLASGQYALAVGMFDRTMLRQLPASTLKAAWENATSPLGALQAHEPREKTPLGEHMVVLVDASFAQGSMTVRVVFDASKSVAGLWFDNIQTASRYQSPPYVDFTRFAEEPTTVGDGEWALPGTLTLPLGATVPVPAVVLVHGSGPQDRNSTIFDNKPFKDLAHGLASRGIAVLRYDKRTKVHGAKIQSESVTPHEETVEDAVLALRLLLADSRIDSQRVYVLGHSLGGMLAPRIAELEPRTAGLILLAGAARPLGDLVLAQTEYLYNLDGELTSIERRHLQTIRAQVNRVKDPKLSARTRSDQLPLGIPAAYWLWLRDYNPINILRKLQKPTFVLQGERDYQVTMDDFALWMSIGNPVEGRSYPHLNHLFMGGTGSPSPAEYEVPGNVAAEVISDIAAWINRNF